MIKSANKSLGWLKRNKLRVAFTLILLSCLFFMGAFLFERHKLLSAKQDFQPNADSTGSLSSGIEDLTSKNADMEDEIEEKNDLIAKLKDIIINQNRKLFNDNFTQLGCKPLTKDEMARYYDLLKQYSSGELSKILGPEASDKERTEFSQKQKESLNEYEALSARSKNYSICLDSAFDGLLIDLGY